jgi:chemotaxis protein histidine kinase CheA
VDLIGETGASFHFSFKQAAFIECFAQTLGIEPEAVHIVRAEDNTQAETMAAMAAANTGESKSSPVGPLRLRLTIAVALPSEQKLGLLLERLLHKNFKPSLVKSLGEKGYHVPLGFVVVHPFSVEDQSIVPPTPAPTPMPSATPSVAPTTAPTTMVDRLKEAKAAAMGAGANEYNHAKMQAATATAAAAAAAAKVMAPLGATLGINSTELRQRAQAAAAAARAQVGEWTPEQVKTWWSRRKEDQRVHGERRKRLEEEQKKEQVTERREAAEAKAKREAEAEAKKRAMEARKREKEEAKMRREENEEATAVCARRKGCEECSFVAKSTSWWSSGAHDGVKCVWCHHEDGVGASGVMFGYGVSMPGLEGKCKSPQEMCPQWVYACPTPAPTPTLDTLAAVGGGERGEGSSTVGVGNAQGAGSGSEEEEVVVLCLPLPPHYVNWANSIGVVRIQSGVSIDKEAEGGERMLKGCNLEALVVQSFFLFAVLIFLTLLLFYLVRRCVGGKRHLTVVNHSDEDEDEERQVLTRPSSSTSSKCQSRKSNKIKASSGERRQRKGSTTRDFGRKSRSGKHRDVDEDTDDDIMQLFDGVLGGSWGGPALYNSRQIQAYHGSAFDHEDL